MSDEVKLPFDDDVAERHAKVSEIIVRHLAAIKAEIVALDPDTLNQGLQPLAGLQAASSEEVSIT